MIQTVDGQPCWIEGDGAMDVAQELIDNGWSIMKVTVRQPANDILIDVNMTNRYFEWPLSPVRQLEREGFEALKYNMQLNIIDAVLRRK